METMMIAVGGVHADFRMVGNDIEVIRVYRKNAVGFNGDYVYTDPRMVDFAKSTIRAVKAGWMKIGKGA